MDALAHEKLDVYKVTLQLLSAAHTLTVRLNGRTAAIIREQLIRAALSVLLNIAEGNGETHAAERAKFFTFARRSADECSACLDALVAVRILRPPDIRPAKDLVTRVVSMLIRLIQKTGASRLPSAQS